MPNGIFLEYIIGENSHLSFLEIKYDASVQKKLYVGTQGRIPRENINVKDEGIRKFLFLENLVETLWEIWQRKNKHRHKQELEREENEGCKALKMPWVKEVRGGEQY